MQGELEHPVRSVVVDLGFRWRGLVVEGASGADRELADVVVEVDAARLVSRCVPGIAVVVPGQHHIAPFRRARSRAARRPARRPSPPRSSEGWCRRRAHELEFAARSWRSQRSCSEPVRAEDVRLLGAGRVQGDHDATRPTSKCQPARGPRASRSNRSNRRPRGCGTRGCPSRGMSTGPRSARSRC